jgi:predicted nucleic acid-binding protein
LTKRVTPAGAARVLPDVNVLIMPSAAMCLGIGPGERHWDIFRRLCIETDIRGSRVSDAWFAAPAIEWGCEWITFDRDHARFPGLKWQLPAAP